MSGRGSNDGQVSIIGGLLSNNRLAAPNPAGIRPSRDRVGGTLFKWLVTRMGGAWVVEPFAGSGGMGLGGVLGGGRPAT
ncbi:RsmD family RNA methyltransferase, partial [Pseudomonas aeruginosa]|nr:RsmD family RNA methyltransferase [Pseudomonas aeruginosa]